MWPNGHLPWRFCDPGNPCNPCDWILTFHWNKTQEWILRMERGRFGFLSFPFQIQSPFLCALLHVLGDKMCGLSSLCLLMGSSQWDMDKRSEGRRVRLGYLFTQFSTVCPHNLGDPSTCVLWGGPFHTDPFSSNQCFPPCSFTSRSVLLFFLIHSTHTYWGPIMFQAQGRKRHNPLSL